MIMYLDRHKRSLLISLLRFVVDNAGNIYNMGYDWDVADVHELEQILCKLKEEKNA